VEIRVKIYVIYHLLFLLQVSNYEFVVYTYFTMYASSTVINDVAN